MLCRRCEDVNFGSSLIQTELPPDFYSSQAFPAGSELPSDATGRFFAHDHHLDVKSLLHSARQRGCHLCTQILWALEQVGLVLDSPHGYHDGPIELRWYPHREKLRAELGVRNRELFAVARTGLRDIRASLTFVRFVSDEGQTESDPLTLPSLLRSRASGVEHRLWNTGCESNLLLAALWLRRCVTQHALCALSTNANSKLPTRVLDIGGRCDPGGNVYLVDGKSRRGPYVALSHVWGKTRIITTLRSNIEQRRRGIPLEALSQTFRDAVCITRKLSIPYLWIDSLCIIQDSAADWSTEAAAMGEYYLNALLTISAVSAAGGQSGIFALRDPHQQSPCPISIRFPVSQDTSNEQHEAGDTTYSLSGFVHPLTERDPSLDTYQYLAHRPPLWQRAWVLQERILSPRLLMFSDVQMSWLCRSERASECIPEGASRERDSSKEEKELQEALLGLTRYSTSQPWTHQPSPGLRRLYDSWYDLVTQYSKCQLTVKTDIFPALSGIVSALAQAISGEQFVAGLWRGDLHRGLLWSAVDSTKQMHDLRTYRAPSWSWASLPGTCAFTFRQMSLADVDTSILQISSIDIAADLRNAYGEVEFGSLTVVGRVKRAHPANADDIEHDPVFSGYRDQPSSGSLYDLEAQIVLGWYMADNNDRANLPEVWCTPILSSDSGGGSLLWHCLAMMELPVGGGGKRMFMRVGMSWVKEPRWFTGVQEEAFTIV